jgi:hypothetical protein
LDEVDESATGSLIFLPGNVLRTLPGSFLGARAGAWSARRFQARLRASS